MNNQEYNLMKDNKTNKANNHMFKQDKNNNNHPNNNRPNIIRDITLKDIV